MIAISRKNFLFAGSDKGGERAATSYTQIKNARLNGLNPKVYLADAIERLARWHLATKFGGLRPWNCDDAIAPEAA